MDDEEKVYEWERKVLRVVYISWTSSQLLDTYSKGALIYIFAGFRFIIKYQLIH